MRSHTGSFMALIIGGDYVQSRKKLNTKSLTEAELVGVYNLLTQVIWTQYFLKYQVYNIHDNVIYHDNQITIKL